MLAHPGCERDVVGPQGRVVAPLPQPCGLGLRADVEQADCDRAELPGRGCREDLAGGYRITRQQQVPALGLKLDRALDGHFGRSLSPLEIRHRGYGDEVTQLNALDLGGQRRCDRGAHGRFAGATRTCHQQQHRADELSYLVAVDLVSLRRRIEAVVRTTLADRGIEVRRAGKGVRRTLPAVLAHYRELGFQPATVIDVGVGPGTPEIYQAFPDARLVMVEPLEEWRGQLELIRAERDAELVIAAAGPQAGEVEIAVHRVPTLSSMLGARPGDSDEPPRRTVPMVRLDDLQRDLGLRGPFLVKVDVEGGELEVLAGATELLKQSDLVLLEVSFFELVGGAPLFHDVVGWMHDYGFVVSELYNGHNRPLDGALAQLDVAFVQEHGRFRRESAYGTPAQHDALYQAWGY